MDDNTVAAAPAVERYKAIPLIKDFFGNVAITDFKAMTSQDRTQLASAIARERKLSQESCEFEFVEY